MRVPDFLAVLVVSHRANWPRLAIRRKENRVEPPLANGVTSNGTERAFLLSKVGKLIINPVF